MLSTVYLDHDWHLTNFPDKLHGVTIVDAVLEGGRKLAPVRGMSFPAFCGENFPVLCKLVGWRYLRLLERDTLDPHCQPVPLCHIFVRIVEVCPSTDLGEGVFYKTRTSIAGPKSIE